MKIETVKEAQKIIERIEANKTAILELKKYAEKGKALFDYTQTYINIMGEPERPTAIHFEDWEIRLMIHNKKQRIAELEKQLERL